MYNLQSKQNCHWKQHSIRTSKSQIRGNVSKLPANK